MASSFVSQAVVNKEPAPLGLPASPKPFAPQLHPLPAGTLILHGGNGFLEWSARIPTVTREQLESGSFWKNHARRLSARDVIHVADESLSFVAKLVVIYSDKMASVRVHAVEWAELPATGEARP